jgi:hypothetical protein
MPEGYWAFGDGVVLRLVNRFQSEVCRALGCSPDTELGRRLADIDNVEPVADIPVYVRWLADRLTIANQRTQLLEAWKRIVREFLDLDDLKDVAYELDDIRAARLGLQLSTQLGLAELVARYREPLRKHIEIDYSKHAADIARALPYRFIVFGHTHEPDMIPLGPGAAGKPAFYVNTGSWRRVVSRPRDSAGPFVARRMAGYFVVHRDEAPGAGRYQLRRDWWAS